MQRKAAGTEHILANTLKDSNVTGSVAQVSSARRHDVRNSITAPSRHVIMLLQQPHQQSCPMKMLQQKAERGSITTDACSKVAILEHESGTQSFRSSAVQHL